MTSELKEVWCGKELERLAMEPGAIVVVKEVITDVDERKPIPAEAGICPSESGTPLDVGNTN